VWGDEHPDSNSLKVHIYNLRKQLEQVNARLSLDTVTGFGFVLNDTSD